MNEFNDKQGMNSATGDDKRLESMLSVCRGQHIDSSRIKSLVHAKIQADEMQKRMASRRSRGWFAAAAVIVVLLTVGIVHFVGPKSVRISSIPADELASGGYCELVVPAGKTDELRLSDGTVLKVNSGSRVLYPEQFEGKERRIYAFGEVYLQVAKDKEHPFIVESDGFDVKVLGTTFNVCNYSDSTASVVLVEGSVEVLGGGDESVRMRPCDKCDILNGGIESLTQVDPANYTAWTRGLIYIDGESLGSLAERLSRHYGRRIECEAALANVKIYGKLDLRDSVETTMAAIAETVPMQLAFSADRITMKDGASK